MTLTSLALAATLLAVPPGEATHNHNSPLKDGQPVVRRFERKPVDDYRRASWNCFTGELDLAWQAYRHAGSTPEAFEQYLVALKQARRSYVYRDPYYVPIVNSASCAPAEPCSCPACCSR